MPYDCHFFIWDCLDGHTIKSLLSTYRGINPFFRAAFFYVDPESARGSRLPVGLLRQLTHQLRVSFGLCLQARPLVAAVCPTTMRLLTEGAPDYVSVAGPRREEPIDSYRSLVGPFCRFVRETIPQAVGVIIDRDVTIDRLMSVVDFGVEGAVGGKSIWSTSATLDVARQFRRILLGGYAREGHGNKTRL